jgi:membrane protein implicated in regulation of membrane protease activity
VKRGSWTLFWIVVITILVLGEVAEITHLFTIPLAAAALSPYALLFALVLITLLALVGAVFVGFYLSSRIYSRRGFTPFEQEMLRMREEVRELREELGQARGNTSRSPSEDPKGGPRT